MRRHDYSGDFVTKDLNSAYKGNTKCFSCVRHYNVATKQTVIKISQDICFFLGQSTSLNHTIFLYNACIRTNFGILILNRNNFVKETFLKYGRAKHMINRNFNTGTYRSFSFLCCNSYMLICSF